MCSRRSEQEFSGKLTCIYIDPPHNIRSAKHEGKTMKSLSARIRAANRTLVAKGKLEEIDKFFTSDYVVHLTDQDVAGGHKVVRGFLEVVFSMPSRTLKSKWRFS